MCQTVQSNIFHYSGGKASGFNNVHERDDYDTDGTMLFKVRCASGESDARATQVEEVGASLSSDDVFVLETPGGTYIWVGQVSAWWGSRGGWAAV